MKALENLRDILCGELEEIARKGEIGAGELEVVHKLTDTIKNIDKIIMLKGGEYSGDYERGDSYANRGKHYVRGHYSRADGRGRMIEQMRDMLEDAGTEKDREAIRRCIKQLEDER